MNIPKRWIGTIVICIVVLSIAALTQQKSAPSVSPARYQLISATVRSEQSKDEPATPTAFMVDTQTGRVWRYEMQNFAVSGHPEAAEQRETFYEIQVDRK